MPKYKRGTLEFPLSVSWDGRQYKITLPKMLVDRLEQSQEINGRFTLTAATLKLMEEYRVVTVEQLIDRWWPVPEVENKVELDEMDWDNLLTRIGVELHNPQDKNVVVSDWDNITYDQFHVSFSIED